MKTILNTLVAVVTVMSLSSNAMAAQQVLEVSEQAKSMFNEKNLDWKLYLHNGQLKTNSRDLLDILRSGEVACAITSMGRIQRRGNVQITMTVDGATRLTARDHYDEIQDGVSLDVNVRVSKYGVRIQDAKATLSCINLDIKNLRMDALRNALGEHIKSR